MPLAFVLVNSIPEKSKQVPERIGEIEGVEETYRVFGGYDIIVVIKAEKIHELKKTITCIRRLEHVVTTLILPIVN